MARETKHNPRQDDELAHRVASLTHGAPVESRTRGERQEELTGEEEAELEGQGLARGAPSGELTPEEVGRRSELAQYLVGVKYPAGKAALVRAAEANGAPAPVLELLDRLPARSQAPTMEWVWESLGGAGEGHGAPGEAEP